MSRIQSRCLQIVLAVGLSLPGAFASAEPQPPPECAADKTFARVTLLLEKQEYGAAKLLLHNLAPCPHLSPVQRFNIGWLYGKAHDPANGLRIFESVAANVPDPLTHGYAIALADVELGRYQEAADALSALRATGVFDARCADLLGVAYSKLGQYQDAYETMAENIRQNPSDAYAYFNLITLFVDTTEMDKAGQVADRAVAALPQSADARSMRGSIELAQSHTDEAYRDFAAAAQLSPRAPDPPFFMALADYRQSKFAEAVNVLRAALSAGIVDSDLHYMMAECLLRIEPANAHGVLDQLNEAVRLDPHSVSARTLRGAVLLNAGRPQDALADLRRARELDPNPQRDTRNTTYLLGRAYAALGNHEEAKALFAQLGHQYSADKADTLNQLSEQKMRAALHP
jgi:tetratricopeptide (TPR) repeat protein